MASLRRKIAAAIVALMAIAVAGVAFALSHESACIPAPAPAQGATLMKAVVHRCYGTPEVLRVEDIEKPVPADNQVLIKVRAAALTALQALRDRGQVRPGHKVLINGASGGVGTFAVQIAKTFGSEVSGVCSTRNVELVRSLGADHVFDYTKEDFTQSGRQFDVILDNVGNRSLGDIRRVLAPEGKYILVGGGGPDTGPWIGAFTGAIKAWAMSYFVDQEMGMFLSESSTADLAILSELMQTGKVTPVIDRTYKLAEAAEAIRYLEEGHARGKVVVSLD